MCSREVNDVDTENLYCIFLHILEGIGLCSKDGDADYMERKRDRIHLKAALNGVKFEVDGHTNGVTTVFNSNCIWECELADIKRMKTDNRPVKLEVFARPENSSLKGIGTLLLPTRGVPVISPTGNGTIQPTLHWHKLGALNPEWRNKKPELYLLLVITKKIHLESELFDAYLGKRKSNDTLPPVIADTTHMLHSQNNIYVQLLEEKGLVQVGNNPDLDCDIFSVMLTFKHIKNLNKLLEIEKSPARLSNIFMFRYVFLGSVANCEIFAKGSDYYPINEKVSMNFKSSVSSLRAYFEQIFYIPIELHVNDVVIAGHHLNFTKFLPEDKYFNTHNDWHMNGTIYFDGFRKSNISATIKPSIDILFSLELLACHSKRNNNEYTSCNEFGESVSELYEQFSSYDIPHGSQTMRDCNKLDKVDRNNLRAYSEPMLLTQSNEDLVINSSEEVLRESIEETEIIQNSAKCYIPNQRNRVKACAEERNNINKLRTTSTVNGKPKEEHEVSDYEQQLHEELACKIVEELEEWKIQQMENFLNELEVRENIYMSNIERQWQERRTFLQTKLESRITKCEELNMKLEKSHIEFNSHKSKHMETVNLVEALKRDIDDSYTEKFKFLDNQMKELKKELQIKSNKLEITSNALENDNLNLERENAELKARIEQLETQISAAAQNNLSGEQFKDLLTDMRSQNDRFAEVEKSKNYYRQQWVKTAREMHKLKLFMIEKEEMIMSSNKDVEFNINFDEILNEEEDALESDRTELKNVKDMLYLSSDSSSDNDEFTKE